MTPQEYEIVSAVFLEALKLSEPERNRLLDERCTDRPKIRARVETMLAQHDTPAADLDSPVFGDQLSPDSVARALASAADEIHPEQIGDYRILGVLGVGGMGVVYRAQQENPQRDVALKVIRAGAVSSDAVRRFEFESQLLGRLKHPNIAQVYEAGTAGTSTGAQPFLAMELVEGRPLNEYASAGKLNVSERLALMTKVCHAVHHAHLKGVIHRDLKPANILVDESGQPKVLDFGVAKAMDPEGDEQAAQTRAGQLIGTVAYMSPEQLAGARDAVDARADVYAMGVLTYEILAGRLPFETNRLSLAEAVKLIESSSPPPLGTLDRTYRGDLETIVSTAMAHDPARRYQSVSEFEDDIRRYMRDEPILARPPSISYQLGKFAKRHRAVCAATVIALIAVLVAGGGVVWGLVEAASERDEARHQTRIAEEINRFLNVDLLGAADPYRDPNPDTTVKQALDRAAQMLDRRFVGEDRVRAAIDYTLGQTYRSLGEYATAEEHLDNARAAYERELGADSPVSLAAGISLADVYRSTARIAEAEALAESTLAACRRELGEDHIETLTCLDTLGQILTDKGEFDSAAKLYENAVGQLPPTPTDHALAIRLRSHLAMVYKRRGELDRAEPLDRIQLELCQEHFGKEHPTTAAAINNLATLYLRQTRFSKAAALLEDAVRIAKTTLGDDHPETLTFQSNLATARMNLKDFKAAAKVFEDVLKKSEAVIGANHIETLTTAHALGVTYGHLDRHEDARAIFEDLLSKCESALGKDHPQTLMVMPYLAMSYQELRRYQDAEELFKIAIARLKSASGEDHPNTLLAIADLAQLYLATNRAREAESLYRQILATDITGHPNAAVIRAIFQTGNGQALVALGQYDDALEALTQAHQTLAVPPWTTSPYSQDVFEAFIELYSRQDMPEEVALWQARLDAAQASD